MGVGGMGLKSGRHKDQKGAYSGSRKHQPLRKRASPGNCTRCIICAQANACEFKRCQRWCVPSILKLMTWHSWDMRERSSSFTQLNSRQVFWVAVKLPEWVYIVNNGVPPI